MEIVFARYHWHLLLIVVKREPQRITISATVISTDHVATNTIQIEWRTRTISHLRKYT